MRRKHIECLILVLKIYMRRKRTRNSVTVFYPFFPVSPFGFTDTIALKSILFKYSSELEKKSDEMLIDFSQLSFDERCRTCANFEVLHNGMAIRWQSVNITHIIFKLKSIHR